MDTDLILYPRGSAESCGSLLRPKFCYAWQSNYLCWWYRNIWVCLFHYPKPRRSFRYAPILCNHVFRTLFSLATIFHADWQKLPMGLATNRCNRCDVRFHDYFALVFEHLDQSRFHKRGTGGASYSNLANHLSFSSHLDCLVLVETFRISSRFEQYLELCPLQPR